MDYKFTHGCNSDQFDRSGAASGRLSGPGEAQGGAFYPDEKRPADCCAVPGGGIAAGDVGELKAVMAGAAFDPDFANDLERINEADEIPTNPWD